MNKIFCGALIVPLFAATGVMAQSLTGSDLSIGYTTATDSDLDSSGLTLGGSAEFAASRELAFQGDLSYTDGEVFGLDGDILSLAGHAIYHANELASFGAYYGIDSDGSDDIAYYGVEAGYDLPRGDVEGYFGLTAVDAGQFDGIDLGDIDLNQYGASVSFDITETFAVSGRYDNLRFSDVASVDRFGLGLGASLGNGFGVSAELGRQSIDIVALGDDNQTYANVTASYTFGAERGATFDRRGLAHTILGF
ncbi:hypothetical protein SAMN05428995_103346 [Loktanella sp. DSM 29012]|uniref:hypothetical protein n=1 Tax=Loktanella sp. DSM 29012 TaxID=1881056 RepID=UPI0008C53BA7|nr:hypothetical protein [Loktanella sp. DSM 29012]SEQ24596.1 hypothetical protein SAMN05428995_103346 [Loktanella sp. DSM 29012]